MKTDEGGGMRRVGIALVASMAGVVVACTTPSSDTAGPTELDTATVPAVDTVIDSVVGTGGVRGVRADGVVRFQGVPYAAPPVGELRFAPPRPAPSWSGIRDAVRPGPVCPQAEEYLAEGTIADEDCLTLNVTVPDRPADDPRPVLVWVHGGGFVLGGAAEHDAARLADRGDIVVVTVGYRLGMFGGLSLPELTDGHLGLLDQQAALRWVRDHIAAFGADPGSVTIAGESAGALSTCSHLASPAAEGLFDRAVVASGSCRTVHLAGSIDPRLPELRPWLPRAEPDRVGVETAAAMGCADPETRLTCLRALPAGDLVAFGPSFTTIPIGNSVLPDDPGVRLRAEWSADVPVLTGAVLDEVLVPATTEPDLGAEDYRARLVTAFGVDAAQVENVYPATAAGTPARTLARVYSDSGWICPTLETAREYSRTAPTWSYRFSDPQAPTPYGEPVPRPSTPHGSDVGYVFDLPQPVRPTGAQRDLGDLMIEYWASFARSGDPATPGAPAWPATTSDGDLALDLTPDPGVRVVGLDSAHHCGMWNALTGGD